MYKLQCSSDVKNTSSAVKTQIKDKQKSTILIYHTEMFPVQENNHSYNINNMLYNSSVEMLVEQTEKAVL